MRFDDRIVTVARLSDEQPSMRVAKWRQLVDLLAQPGTSPSEARDEAFAYLSDHRAEVPRDVRGEMARALSGRDIAPDLFAFFGEDEPRVVAPLIAGASLPIPVWLEVLPSLSPTARALLRHRRDLDAEVTRALDSFGASDLALAGAVDETLAAVPQPDAANGGEAQIRDLVARIEAFRKQQPSPALVQPVAEAAQAFRWETGISGSILWVDGAPRGALIGQSIASIAERGQFGVDGQAAGAFEKRAPFRDARFNVAGNGPASGDWRISGVPYFDAESGSFLGYRGSARRPRVDEVARLHAVADEERLFGSTLPADALRQLIHELRTPLNAIIGFAEMIDGQYMGPAADGYRSRASEIMEQASRLLSAVDDLDTAARIETSRLSLETSTVDAVALLCRLHDAYERVADQRNARIAVEIERDLPAAKVELGAAERMFARILAATIGLAQSGETIAATMAMGQLAGVRMLCLAIDRPQAIAGRDDAALLDPGYSPDGDWPAAPALGLGFALRLVRSLAEAVGGALVIGSDRFTLYLPTADMVELSSESGA